MLEPHRTMERPGQGIVRPSGPTTSHSEYPKHMVHPGFQPGVAAKEISVPDPVSGKPWRKAYVGDQAIRLPPVLAMDENQEEYHKSQGYVTIGKSNPAAFARAVAAATPQAETHVPDQYPKWIAALGRSVNSTEEEAAALGLQLDEDGLVRLTSGSSEESGAEPTISAEVKTLLDRPDIAAQDVRLDALERKVDTIASSFDRLSDMLAKVIDGHASQPAPEAAPERPRPPPMSEAAPDEVPSARSAESIARGEKIRAGIAKRKAAEAAAKATEAVVTEATEAVE